MKIRERGSYGMPSRREGSSLNCRSSEVEQNGAASNVTRTYLSDQWREIEGACGPLYVPALDDKGLKLRVQCTPARYACPSSRKPWRAGHLASFCWAQAVFATGTLDLLRQKLQ